MNNKEAIEFLMMLSLEYKPRTFEYTSLNKIINLLRENEPKKGEWIKKVDDVGFVSYICSECGFELELEDCSDSYYCSECGAKMENPKYG